MATLTETAYLSRNIIKWGIIGLIVLTILRFLFGYLIETIRRALPAPQLRPNQLYGKLPAISFPESASPSGELTYTLQTISGSLPEASAAARVYFMPKGQANLLSLSKAQEFVAKIGFTTPPREVSETVYRWVDPKNPLRSIEMNIVSNHYIYSYAFVHDLTLFTEKFVPDPFQAVNESLAFLQVLGLNQTDIDTTDTRVVYLQLRGNQLEPTTSQSTADAVQVDFFRKKIDGTKVLTDDPDKGNIRFVLSGSRRVDRRILSVEYKYWPLEMPSSGRDAIYKLKTTQEMWEDLTSNKAYFLSLPQNKSTIVVTNAYLAYYDSFGPQLFLQPIMVFEGEDNFSAYVSAVAPPWIE